MFIVPKPTFYLFFSLNNYIHCSDIGFNLTYILTRVVHYWKKMSSTLNFELAFHSIQVRILIWMHCKFIYFPWMCIVYKIYSSINYYSVCKRSREDFYRKMTFLIQYRRLKIDKLCTPFWASFSIWKNVSQKINFSFWGKQLVWLLKIVLFGILAQHAQGTDTRKLHFCIKK